ncbi:hypothetical protein ACET3X_000471 [Alternaria dauci]|uniref:Uncharacterized protein n=1 Tax=Alternaria dauci TaxID=48095 RepID=A0ABR3UWB9_9PLEO
MPKPSSSKTISFAPQDYNQAGNKKPSPKEKTGHELSGTQSFKGYMYIDHPLVLPDEIFCDSPSPRNIINGKRTRSASNPNESPSEKAAPAVETNNNDKAKGSHKKPSIKLASPAKSRALSENRGDRKSCSHNEEYDANSFEKEVSLEVIRRDILALVKRSLRIADDVSAYMQCIEGHETQGQKLDRDVGSLLDHRVQKRKAVAQEWKGGKVARTLI